MLEKGYDTEYVNKLIHDADAMSVIPARGDNVLIWRISDSLQKADEAKLSRDIERNKTETIFSVIKRIIDEVTEPRG